MDEVSAKFLSFLESILMLASLSSKSVNFCENPIKIKSIFQLALNEDVYAVQTAAQSGKSEHRQSHSKDVHVDDSFLEEFREICTAISILTVLFPHVKQCTFRSQTIEN